MANAFADNTASCRLMERVGMRPPEAHESFRLGPWLLAQYEGLHGLMSVYPFGSYWL
jgi:RimJ/RimL family protein N-acetyltransferase